MEKDINTDQKTSSDRPFRPLTPLEKEGVMIAEFMGLKYETRNYFGGDFKPDENGFDTYSHNSIMTGTYYGGEKTSMLVDKMRYHTSWNWLMPVIDKIETMGCEVVHRVGDCNIYEIDEQENYKCIIDVQGINKLESTYKAVVKFIKDYNDGKKQ
jgi:hypothetical protein